MNDQNTQKLFNDFPDLFDKHPKHHISLWGFECRDGWFDIVYSLSKKIYDLREKARGNKGQTNVAHLRARGGKVKVVQVKQKMGTLSFYMDDATEEMTALAHLADKEARQTCELCGMKGKTRRVRNWYTTLCQVHFRERIERDPPISQLDQEVWDCCVHRRAADNEEMSERWQNDPIAYLQEGFVIDRLPSSILPLVEQAITEWKQIEEDIFSNLQMSREQFLEEFEKARSSFQSGGNEWVAITRYGSVLQGTVGKLRVVQLFALILPAADPERRQEHRSMGRMVTAIFYAELLSRGEGEPGFNATTFRQMEALWRLVNSAE